MAENDEKSVGLNFLAGVGIGALVGAGVALLLAPKSGPETRDELKKAMQDLSKSTEELRKKSAETFEGARSKVQQAYDTGRESIQKKMNHETSEETPS